MEFTVMIVDDDEICLLIHKQIVEVTGFHSAPLSFNSAEKALEFLKVLSADKYPVLLLLDINMPVMNGWEFLNIIQHEEYAKQVQVAIVTSSVDARDRKTAFSFSNVFDLIEKPFNEMSLKKLGLKLPWL